MQPTRRKFLVGLTVTATAGTGTMPVVAAEEPHLPSPQGLSSPTGKPILTITGKIRVCNTEDAAQFDRPMLEALGLAEFTTKTPWYNDPVSFEGVPMVRLVEAVGAYGGTAIATALNDYETTIPVADFGEFNVLLALKRNGAYMPISDKGPLFIIYPFDSNPTLRTQKYFSRSAWQLSKLKFA